MALDAPWMLVIAAVAVVVAIVVGILLGLRGRRRRAEDGAAIARAERVRALPSVAAAVRRRTMAAVAVLALAVVAVLAAGIVAARPMSAQTVQPVTSNRDVMLCLDVSGSMSEVDVEVLRVFEDLLPGLQGERIGLTIFNSSPVQVFPLTDDYEFIRTQLQNIRDSFDYYDEIPEHWVGTLNGPGGSLIGDGLASCAMRFDQLETERSRSIIFATDNEVNGASIVTLEEAAQYAASLGVRVFALNPVDGVDAEASAELAQVAAITGGALYPLRETATVDDIVTDIQEQEATELRGQVQIIRTDAPEPWIVVAVVLALGTIVLLWRVRL